MARFRTSMVALFLSLAGAPVLADVDQRWVFTPSDPDSGRPMATYLSQDREAVIFRATCNQATRELVLEYLGEGDGTPVEDGYMRIVSSDVLVSFDTGMKDGVLVGRRPVNPGVISLIERGGLEIDVRNEMGESWYVGDTDPLLEIAKLCG